MKLTAFSVFNAVLMAGVVILGGFKAVTYARPQTPASAIAAGPAEWVAFSARVDIVSPGLTVYGTFIQGSDGSTKKETGPTPDDIRVVDIKNVSLERAYLYHRENGWSEHSMKLPPRWMPRNFGAHLLQNARPTKYESFDAFTLTWPDGRIEMIVPALNYFIVDRVLPNGRREQFHDIQLLSSVASDAFVPPPGSQVRVSETPAGIIRTDPGALEVDASGKVTWKKKAQ